jgi:copper chaperone NosL
MYKSVSNNLLVCLLALVILAACGGKSGEPRPPEIQYGQDMCSACGMLISEARFAAATLLTSGEARKFDDIGEMLVYHMDHPEEQVQAWFVHDYASESWIRGESAFFVKSEAIKSPMGSGIVALEKKADAEAFAAQVQGLIYSLDEIRGQEHMDVHG